jgi:hypothetical protein
MRHRLRRIISLVALVGNIRGAMKMSADNKILFEMTLDNLPENIRIFYDILIELFINMKKMDKKLNGEDNMLYLKLPYMQKIVKKLNV